MVYTNVPNQKPISLPAYYEEFAQYYPNCEMQTKQWFAENAKPDWVFLDIGANIGYYSILFSRLAPEGKIYAFEPTNTFDMLKENLEYNKARNVIPYKMAVGNLTGIRTDKFYRIWDDKVDKAESLECPFTTIDSFVEENNITRIDAIKIDVDSYDYEVLQGAVNTLKRFNPFVMVEIADKTLSKRGFSTGEVYEWLYNEAGYRTTCIFDGENYLFKQNLDAKDIPYPNVWSLEKLMKQPYLSIVTISRNDEHGGDPNRRTQIFINSYAWQAEHYKLETELVLIDWNPPKDKPGLAEILNFPANDYFYARVIIVPPDVHEGFRYSSSLPMFQFIGKNAGIRRARGEFILATCMDSILDDKLFEYIAKKKLNEDWLYRADLYDVKNTIPDVDHIEQQIFCRNPENEDQIRYTVYKFQKYRSLWKKDRIHIKNIQKNENLFPLIEFINDEGVTIGKSTNNDGQNLNLGACGDFTLMHKDAWGKLHAYGEFESFSWGIDSQLLISASFFGLTEANFIPPLTLYHIAHGFERTDTSTFISAEEHMTKLSKSDIPVFYCNNAFNTMVSYLKQNNKDVLNDDRWGLRGLNLEEYIFEMDGMKHLDLKPAPINFKPLSAIKPEFYFEVLDKKEQKEEVVRIPSKADRVVEKLRRHRIIWSLIRLSFRIFAKIYRGLRKVKKFIKRS